jgi:lambda repressor-like predicted transcriptional regulator
MNPEQQYQYGQQTGPSGGQPPAVPPQPQAPQLNQSGGYDVVPPPNHIAGPGNGGHNPYEFIFAEERQPKQGFFSGGSTLKRILVAVGGVVILAIIAAIVVSLITPKDTSYEKLTAILQEQQEIVRVADLTDKSASGTDLRNLAVNTSLSVSTNKTSLQTYLTKRKVKITDVVLAGKQDAKTDTLLANAKSANTFDNTAAQTLQTLLVTYRANLNTTYQDVKGANARTELKKSYQTAELLIAEANKLVGQ